MGFKSSYSDYINTYLKNNKEIHPTNEFLADSKTASADFQYYRSKFSEMDTKYNFKFNNGDNTFNKRITKKIKEITDALDIRQTQTSFAPNLTHFYDSEMIRILHLDPYNLQFASIHDAFIISSFECGKLVHSYGSIFKTKIRFNHNIPITVLM